MLGIDLHKLKGLKFTHLIGNKLYGYYDRNGRDCGIVWDMAHALPRDTQLETYREQGLNVRGQYHSWTTCEQSIIRAIVLGRLTKTQLVQGLHARGYRDFKIIDDYVGGFVVIRDDREIGGQISYIPNVNQ